MTPKRRIDSEPTRSRFAGSFEARRSKATKAEIIRAENRRREQLLGSRVEGLEQQRRRLEQEASALREEADQLSDVAGKAILDAVASSLGMPPGLVEAAHQGDIKAAALSALEIPGVKEEITGIVDSLSGLYPSACRPVPAG